MLQVRPNIRGLRSEKKCMEETTGGLAPTNTATTQNYSSSLHSVA